MGAGVPGRAWLYVHWFLVVTALKEALEKRGVLGQIRANIRAEVFHALDDQSEPRPPLSRENLLINELVREYLEYNKYKYTASVLTAGRGPGVGFVSAVLGCHCDVLSNCTMELRGGNEVHNLFFPWK